MQIANISTLLGTVADYRGTEKGLKAVVFNIWCGNQLMEKLFVFKII